MGYNVTIMKRTEQLIKELQMLVNDEELNGIIDDKMMGMWRDARCDAATEYVKEQNAYWTEYKKHITREQIEEMRRSHRFQQTSDYSEDEECYKCGIDYDYFDDKPQWCDCSKL